MVKERWGRRGGGGAPVWEGVQSWNGRTVDKWERWEARVRVRVKWVETWQ